MAVPPAQQQPQQQQPQPPAGSHSSELKKIPCALMIRPPYDPVKFGFPAPAADPNTVLVPAPSVMDKFSDIPAALLQRVALPSCITPSLAREKIDSAEHVVPNPWIVIRDFDARLRSNTEADRAFVSKGLSFRPEETTAKFRLQAEEEYSVEMRYMQEITSGGDKTKKQIVVSPVSIGIRRALHHFKRVYSRRHLGGEYISIMIKNHVMFFSLGDVRKLPPPPVPELDPQGNPITDPEDEYEPIQIEMVGLLSDTALGARQGHNPLYSTVIDWQAMHAAKVELTGVPWDEDFAAWYALVDLRMDETLFLHIIDVWTGLLKGLKLSKTHTNVFQDWQHFFSIRASRHDEYLNQPFYRSCVAHVQAMINDGREGLTPAIMYQEACREGYGFVFRASEVFKMAIELDRKAHFDDLCENIKTNGCYLVGKTELVETLASLAPTFDHTYALGILKQAALVVEWLRAVHDEHAKMCTKENEEAWRKKLREQQEKPTE